MARIVHLAASLPAPSERLYEMYLDPERHAAITGAPVTIAAQAGAAFRAFDGMLSGTILQVAPSRLIVQSWRSANWQPDDLDSTLVLRFVPAGTDAGRIELTHVNIPESDFAGVSRGWEKYYWAPWRAYLDAERGVDQGSAAS